MSARTNNQDSDIYSPAKRSEVMSKVRSRNTKPELIVRSLLHHMGYRFRLHRADLPGKPDIVLPKYQTVIFVHGCFWHQHSGCKKATLPKKNFDFWQAKLEANRSRDIQHVDDLTKAGWQVIVVWECETKDIDALEKTLRKSLSKSTR